MEKIFYTNTRGSGKTKWLVDQYVKERCAGNCCVYLGNEFRRRHFVEEVSNRGLSYSAGLPENDSYRCPVLCFFTDDLECEIGTKNLCSDKHHFINARWYITLDNDCFDKKSKLQKGVFIVTCKDCIHCGACKESAYQYEGDVSAHCKAYSNKSEWVHLPCKTGDIAYYPLGYGKYAQIVEEPLKGWGVIGNNLCVIDERGDFYNVGTEVFLSKEEAERALEEMRKM